MRIFLGPRASGELDLALDSKGVGRCDKCNAVCVSPDQQRLAAGLRVHIACAAKSGEKILWEDALAGEEQGAKKAATKAGGGVAASAAARKGKRGRAKEEEEEEGAGEEDV
jgi:hypothetical protein